MIRKCLLFLKKIEMLNVNQKIPYDKNRLIARTKFNLCLIYETLRVFLIFLKSKNTIHEYMRKSRINIPLECKKINNFF